MEHVTKELMDELKLNLEGALDDLRVLESFPKRVKTAFVKATEEMDAMSNQLCEAADARYKQIRARSDAINKAVEALSRDVCRFPYGIKDTLDLAERCCHYTDEQWARVIELAKALASAR